MPLLPSPSMRKARSAEGNYQDSRPQRGLACSSGYRIVELHDDIRKGFSRISKNAKCPFKSSSFQTFFKSPVFHKPTSECGGLGFLGISKHFRSREPPYL